MTHNNGVQFVVVRQLDDCFKVVVWYVEKCVRLKVKNI